MNHSFSSIDTALIHFTKGGLLVVVDDESRENEGDIVFSAALSTPEKVNFCATHARGLVCIAISKNIAKKIDLHPVLVMQRIHLVRRFMIP